MLPGSYVREVKVKLLAVNPYCLRPETSVWDLQGRRDKPIPVSCSNLCTGTYWSTHTTNKYNKENNVRDVSMALSISKYYFFEFSF